jgi:hypothetical protein
MGRTPNLLKIISGVAFSMSHNVFESFRRMIHQMPPKAILMAVERQGRMMEDDLVNERNLDKGEAISVLNFCRFIKVVSSGLTVPSPCFVPVSHVAFYRKIVCKLIEAEELPAYAKNQFDEVFAENFLKRLAA